MLFVWLGVCAAASWFFRRRPDVIVLTALGMWVLVPSVAGEVLTGVPYTTSSSISMHPAAWLVLVYASLLAVLGSMKADSAILAGGPLRWLLLVWVIVAAGCLTMMQLGVSALKGYLDIFVS